MTARILETEQIQKAKIVLGLLTKSDLLHKPAIPLP